MKKAIKWAVGNPFWVTAITCVVFYFLPFKPRPFGDHDYHIGTIQLIEYFLHGFSGNVMINKGFVTLFCYLPAYLVAYPFHSDAAYFACGVTFSCIFVCLAVKLLFDTFRLMGFGQRTKAVILLLLSLFPVHVYYAMGIIGEAFAFFAAAAFLYCWLMIVNGRMTLRFFIALGLSLVMLYGLKPSLLPFIIVFTIYIFFVRFETRLKLAFLGTMLLLPLCFFAEKQLDDSDMGFKEAVFRNQILWSRYELRDEPWNWLPQHGHGPYASSDYLNNLKKRVELDSICQAKGFDPTQYYIEWVKNDIVSHPGLTLRQYAMKFFQSQSFIISPLMKSTKPAIVKYGIHIYINMINAILVIFGLFGLVALFRDRNYRIALPLLFFWGWSLLYVCVFHSEQRYLFVFRSGLVFLAAYYIDLLIKRRNSAKPL